MVVNIRLVLFVIGLMLVVVAAFMMVPVVVDLASENDDWQVFLASAAVTIFAGLSLILTNRGSGGRFQVREMFLLTTLSWVFIAAFGALPFAFSILDLSVTDAFFESMSGITTTGATVIVGLQDVPPGILIWRALLQWLGGIGIIVMAIAVLPNLQVGGMQLFRTESSDQSDKALPRTAQNAAGVAAIYVAFTLACAIGYWTAGMTPFDGICHAMTTIATGGFSTFDASLGHFDNSGVPWIATVFMILGGMPFVLYFRVVRSLSARAARGDRMALLQDAQVRWFLTILALAILLGTLYRVGQGVEIETALRHVAFNVTSVMTGTGYAIGDYGAWGGPAMAGFFLLMFVGGCAGSTTCGIKIFRFQIMYATAVVQLKRLLQPNGVFMPYYNGRPIGDDVSASVMGFFFLFVITYAWLAILLGLMGLDFVTALSAAAAAMANVGPGLGEIIGPSGTFAPLPEEAKWLLSIGMLLGRLELTTVFVLFTIAFWRD